jgi:L-ascorbate metabolism protein UlaG (beta-lactamase superfamily)
MAMKYQKTLNGLAVAAFLLVIAWSYLFGYPKAAIDPAWEVAPAENIPDGAVTVRYSGTATLLFSDGKTQWMTDGWFTRPGPLQTVLGEIEPDMDAISFGLAAMEVDELAAVIPLHSHYDHAMDAPEVARRTGATVMGSTATANIARGWELPEEQIKVVSDGEAVALGDFTVRFIESKHFQFPDPEMVAVMLTDSEIPGPLVPPVSAFDYKLGKAYMLHVTHPRGSFLVVGSAGFVPGQLAALDVDVVFLGTGGIGSQTAEYREQYWAETVGQVAPERIIPIHWDSLTGPLDGPMTGEVRIGSFLSAGTDDALAFLKAREAELRGVPFQTLPRFAPVVLFP